MSSKKIYPLGGLTTMALGCESRLDTSVLTMVELSNIATDILPCLSSVQYMLLPHQSMAIPSILLPAIKNKIKIGYYIYFANFIFSVVIASGKSYFIERYLH